MGQDQKNLDHKSTTGQAPTQQTTPRSDRANEQNRPNTSQMNERGGAIRTSARRDAE